MRHRSVVFFKISIIVSFIWALLALMLNPQNAFSADTDSAHYIQFNVENGLPSNYVYCVVQDRQGYIWFLTDKGIVKYNGYSFKLFNTSTGLPSDDIWYLSEDSLGRLWVHTYSYEIGYIKNDVYHKININTEKKLTKLFSVFNGGRFTYLRTSSALKRVFVIDSTDQVHVLNMEMYEPNIIEMFGDKIVLASTNDHTIAQATPTGLKKIVRCRHPQRDNVIYFSLSRLTPDYHGILVNPNGSDYAYIDIRNCEMKIGDIKQLGGQQDEKIYLAYPANRGFQVLTNRSVYFINSNFSLREKLNYLDLLPSSTQLTYYLADASHKKWLTTKSAGCIQIGASANEFKRDFTLDETLRGSKKYLVTKDGASWWFNENSLDLFGLDKFGKVISTTRLPARIKSAAEGNGKIYLAFHEKVELFDVQTSKMKSLNSGNFPVYVKNLLNYDYKFLLKPRKDGVEELSGPAKLEAFREFKGMQVYKNKVYGFTPHGVRKIELDSNYLRLETIESGSYSGICYDSSNNRYWFYNKGSILLLNPETDRYKIIDNEQLRLLGLNAIQSITMDRFGNVFVHNGNKVFLANMKMWLFRQLSLHVNTSDISMDIDNNTVVLAGRFGVTYARSIGPMKISKFSLVPNSKARLYKQVYDVVINGVGESVVMNTDRGVFKVRLQTGGNRNAKAHDGWLVTTIPHHERIVDHDTINVSADDERIQFDYINYDGNGQRDFSYKIPGSSNWQENSSGDVFLGDLKPDRYYTCQLKVKDELWETPVYSLHFYKVPHWYQTSNWRVIFWIGGILLFLVAILISILITKRIIARTNTKRSLQVELELRAIHSQINPHFIFNTLSSVQYFISKKNFEEAYVHVNKFSKLLRLYLQSSRNRYTVLSEEVEMLSKYIDLQKVRFEGKFDYTIEIDKRIPADSIQIPSLLLQPLVENAINHGLFHIEGGGLLQIKFVQGSSSDELLCYIDDNGVGRERSKEIKNESENYRRSYGTKLTEELIELFEKYEKMNIEMEYLDKKAPETGTVVKLTLRNMKYLV